jgi:ATP-dependent RNA helicase RhlE
MTFSELGLIEPILKALATEGYSTPTPIQQQAIPIILEQRDLLGCAQTGTGKTAAFALPIIQLHHQNPSQKNNLKIRTLILTPTRELAIQIGDSFKAYGANTQLRHTVIFGGVGQQPQTDALRRGVEILIATPGRLLDLMQQGFVNLQHLEVFVLDEADRMLDMGFIHDVRKVIAKLPSQRQTLFFSATMPPEIQKLADSILNKPEKVAVTPVSSTAETVQQLLYFVEKNEKRDLLNVLLLNPDIKAALVFSRTKHGANKIAKELLKVRISAEAIHGNKSQTARQTALSNFKSGKTRVLVATDIAARGIDIDDLAYVFNYDLPNIPETYVHRIGRTGRAGASGQAISFCDTEERAYLKDIEKLIGKKVPVGTVSPELMKNRPAPVENNDTSDTNAATSEARPAQRNEGRRPQQQERNQPRQQQKPQQQERNQPRQQQNGQQQKPQQQERNQPRQQQNGQQQKPQQQERNQPRQQENGQQQRPQQQERNQPRQQQNGQQQKPQQQERNQPRQQQNGQPQPQERNQPRQQQNGQPQKPQQQDRNQPRQQQNGQQQQQRQQQDRNQQRNQQQHQQKNTPKPVQEKKTDWGDLDSFEW